MADVIDFVDKLKQAAEQADITEGELVCDVRDDFFNDDDVMDVFTTMLLFIRSLSLTNTVVIKITDDQIFLESKNFMEHEHEHDVIEQADCLTKVASMYLLDDDDNILPTDELTISFQAMLEAVIIRDDS
jgi:hypothetical protein